MGIYGFVHEFVYKSLPHYLAQPTIQASPWKNCARPSAAATEMTARETLLKRVQLISTDSLEVASKGINQRTLKLVEVSLIICVRYYFR